MPACLVGFLGSDRLEAALNQFLNTHMLLINFYNGTDSQVEDFKSIAL